MVVFTYITRKLLRIVAFSFTCFFKILIGFSTFNLRDAQVTDDVRVIDATGKFVMPGIFFYSIAIIC